MGVKFSRLVWQYATVKAERLLVLLALADWANEQGECWPSVVQVAAKARVTERAAHTILSELAEQGVISKTAGGGRGLRSHYILQAETLKPDQGKPTRKPRRKTLKAEQGLAVAETLKGKQCLTNSVSETVIPETVETLKPTTLNPEADDMPYKEYNHHEPSIEPSLFKEAVPLLSKKRTQDLFYDIFCEKYVLSYRGSKYQNKRADFVQLAAAIDAQGTIAETNWRQAVDNYFLSERSPRTLADLATNYAEFRLHARDKFGQPLKSGGNGNGPHKRLEQPVLRAYAESTAEDNRLAALPVIVPRRGV